MYNSNQFGLAPIRSYGHYESIRCPFHNDRNPSAIFIKEIPAIKCYSCGSHVVGVNEIIRKLKISGDARSFLLFESDGEKSLRLGDLTRDALPWSSPIVESGEAIDYLQSQRGIDINTITNQEELNQQIAWAAKDRAVVFKMVNAKGVHVGDVCRLTKDHVEPRYVIYGEKTPLWPSFNFNKNVTKPLFIFEGPFKLLSFIQAANRCGLGDEIETRCTMGSTWKNTTIDILRNIEGPKVLIGDDDKAGRKMAKELRSKVHGARCLVPSIPFDEMSRDQAIETFQNIYSGVMSHETSITRRLI